VIGKKTVNTTLAKGYHAQTLRTARNLLIFSHDSSTPINYTLLFFTGKDDYSQDRFLVIQISDQCSTKAETTWARPTKSDVMEEDRCEQSERSSEQVKFFNHDC
jgi:hypothetical protein